MSFTAANLAPHRGMHNVLQAALLRAGSAMPQDDIQRCRKNIEKPHIAVTIHGFFNGLSARQAAFDGKLLAISPV